MLIRSRKRQLIYRLGRWGCTKYNKDSTNATECDEDFDAGYEDDADDYNEDMDDDKSQMYACHLLDGCEVQCAENRSFDEGVPGLQDQVPWDVQIANAQLAVSDGVDAWEIFRRRVAEESGDPQGVVALARAAETPEQCRETLELLRQQDPWVSDQAALHRLHLLYALVRDSEAFEMDEEAARYGVEEDAEGIIAAAVSWVLSSDGRGFLLGEAGSVDMISYFLLELVYEKRLLPPEAILDEERLNTLLDQVDGWVLSGNHGHHAAPVTMALVQCAQWCHQQLYEISNKLASNSLDGVSRPDLRVSPGKYNVKWKEHIEIFGTLWHRLAMQQLSSDGAAGGGGPEWARRAVVDLGISHAELLSCMCWAIVTLAIGRAGELLTRARIAAHEVCHMPPPGLWVMFRDAFWRMNDLTATSGGDEHRGVREEKRRFRDAAMREFGDFVNKTYVGKAL